MTRFITTNPPTTQGPKKPQRNFAGQVQDKPGVKPSACENQVEKITVQVLGSNFKSLAVVNE